MKCKNIDCFAYSVEEENCCSALDEAIDYCAFYKTAQEIENQRRILLLKGKITLSEVVTQQQKTLYNHGDYLALWMLQEKR